jgi:AcrR family transcriptional regulator
MTPDSTKLNKTQWLEFALSELVKKGPDSLKIIKLCDVKGVTKGSFYHHFKNRQSFIEALMGFWFDTMTMAFIDQANLEAAPMDRLKKLDQIIASHNIEAELHIRAWSLKDTQVAKHLAKIDQQRQDYLADCYRDMGIENTRANDIAAITYGLFLGLQHIHPRPDTTTNQRLSEFAGQTLLQAELG